jgi:hypothetical protein
MANNDEELVNNEELVDGGYISLLIEESPEGLREVVEEGSGEVRDGCGPELGSILVGCGIELNTLGGG